MQLSSITPLRRFSLGISLSVHAVALGCAVTVLFASDSPREGKAKTLFCGERFEQPAFEQSERLEPEVEDPFEPEAPTLIVGEAVPEIPESAPRFDSPPLFEVPDWAVARSFAVLADEEVAPPPSEPPAREGVTEAILVYAPPPIYPRMSVRLGEEGELVCRIRVAANGRVLAVEVTESSGHARLDEAAREAILAWRFEPETLGSDGVETEILHTIVFRLTDA